MRDDVTEHPTPAACGICGQTVQDPEAAIVTAASLLHVACVEESAAAA